MKVETLSIDRNTEGAWRVTGLVNGCYVTRVFYGYTKRESVARFRQYVREGGR